MDYEEMYKKALERAKQELSVSHINSDSERQLYRLFPELKEGEDEKIRKELIEFVKSRGGFKQEYIVWLEKQGEQKPICLLDNSESNVKFTFKGIGGREMIEVQCSFCYYKSCKVRGLTNACIDCPLEKLTKEAEK